MCCMDTSIWVNSLLMSKETVCSCCREVFKYPMTSGNCSRENLNIPCPRLDADWHILLRSCALWYSLKNNIINKVQLCSYLGESFLGGFLHFFAATSVASLTTLTSLCSCASIVDIVLLFASWCMCFLALVSWSMHCVSRLVGIVVDESSFDWCSYLHTGSSGASTSFLLKLPLY